MRRAEKDRLDDEAGYAIEVPNPGGVKVWISMNPSRLEFRSRRGIDIQGRGVRAGGRGISRPTREIMV